MSIEDILRQHTKNSDGSSCRLHSSVIEAEFRFVQFYNIIPCFHFSADLVDRTLGCVGAKRDRRVSAHSILVVSKLFRLDLVDGVRGRVHMVPANICINPLHGDTQRENQVAVFNDRYYDWKKDTSYLNRFFRDKDKKYHFTDVNANKSC